MVRLVSGDAYSGSDAYAWPMPHRGCADELVYPQLAYSVRPGNRPLFLDLHVPRSVDPAPVVVWLHGGGFERGSRSRHEAPIEQAFLTERLLLAGFAVADVDYRLVREATFPEPLWDVRTALGWLARNSEELHLDLSRLALFGESSGGTLALLASLPHEWTPKVNCVASWYAMADTAWLDGDFDDAMEEQDARVRQALHRGGWTGAQASMLVQANSQTPPCLLAVGADDSSFIVDSNQALADKLSQLGVGVELIKVPGGRVFQNPVDPTDQTNLRKVLDQTIKFLVENCQVEQNSAKNSLPAKKSLWPASSEIEQIQILGHEITVQIYSPVASSQAIVIVPAPETNDHSKESVGISHELASRISASLPATVIALVGGKGMEETIAVTWWVHESVDRFGAVPVILAGESAGGGNVLEVAKRCRDSSIPVDGLGLCYPVLPDGFDLTDPQSLAGLPVVILAVGGKDLNLDENLRLVYQLRSAGVATRLQIFPTLDHGFALDAADPDVRRAIQSMLAAWSQWVWDGTLS